MSNTPKIKGRPTFPAERTQPDTPHGVALALTWEIMASERMDSDTPPEEAETDYRKYLLDLYAECLTATEGKRRI